MFPLHTFPESFTQGLLWACLLLGIPKCWCFLGHPSFLSAYTSKQFHLLHASLSTHKPMILISVCPAQISVMSSDKLAWCPLVLCSWPCHWGHKFNTSKNSLGFAKYAQTPRIPLLGMTVASAGAWKFFFYFLLLSNASSLTCLRVWFVLVPNMLPHTASPLFLLCQGLRRSS